MNIVEYEKEYSRMILCPSCSTEIWSYVTSGMSQCFPHFYCNQCSNVIHRESDKEEVLKSDCNFEIVGDQSCAQALLEKIANSLPECPCGGMFKPGENPKCPSCRYEFKHGYDEIYRLNDPYMIVLDNVCVFGDTGSDITPYRIRIT
jgi:hypothetical protein